MKKAIALLLTGSMLASVLTAVYGAPAIRVQAEAAEVLEEEDESSEDAADIYGGLWAESTAERVVLTLEPTDEEGVFDAEITWREDLPQKDVFTMQARYQEDGSLYYEDCTYVLRYFEDDGTFTDELQYEDGSGLFWYDPDAELLYWTDYTEDPEDNVVSFIRADFADGSIEGTYTGRLDLDDNFAGSVGGYTLEITAAEEEGVFNALATILPTEYVAEQTGASGAVLNATLRYQEDGIYDAFNIDAIREAGGDGLEIYAYEDGTVTMQAAEGAELAEETAAAAEGTFYGVFCYDPETETMYWTEQDFGDGFFLVFTKDAPAEEALVTTGGTPWIDSDLKENILPDMELSEKDDFHLYINYDWLAENEIPDGKKSYNAFTEVMDRTNEKALAILDDDTLAGHDAKLIQALYHAYLDWEARDEAGLAPAQAVVEDIMSIDSIDALSDFICDPERSMFVPTLLNMANAAGLEDSSSYITYIVTDGLSLGDSAEYEERTEMGNRVEQANIGLLEAILSRMDYTVHGADMLYDRMMSVENRLAESTYTNAQMRDPGIYALINNVYTPEELAELSPVFPIARFLESAGYQDAGQFLIYEPDAIKTVNELYTEENLEDIKAYCVVKYVLSVASYMDSEAYDAVILADNITNGSQGREADEITAFNIVRSALSGPMDRAYLEKYDASELKEEIRKICEDIIGVYRDMLAEEEWLSEETREKAIEKLDNMRINSVYPDKWIDYSSLDLTGLSYYDCMKAIFVFEQKLNAGYTNGRIDPEIWDLDILEANAYYNPYDNSINIILGLLNEPFYYEGMSKEAVLGTIGCVVGHEISHAFDTNGAQFDKDGNFANWWTQEDYAAFQERAEKLIAYYDAIQAWDGRPIIGRLVQTEAIADMAGIKAVLTIAAGEEDFDYDEFFRAFATIWRRLNTREAEFNYITQDSHPMHYLRTNATLQQFDEFLKTYDIQEGDNMYLSEEDRVLVW